MIQSGSRISIIAAIVLTCLLYVFYIHGLAYNPPGFYLDESAGSYNAYLIGTTGESEFGDLPLYPKYYTGSRVEQGNPTHLYMLAAMYVFIPPSVVSARILAATTVFVACVLLGLLAGKLSGRFSIGIIVGITATLTPWLFDASRLVLEVFTYPLSVILLLLCIYSANKRDRWTIRDNVFIAISLALVTYSYSVGRLLGPALAFGLIVFAFNRTRIISVLTTWVAFAITLVPLAIFTLTKPGALSKRFVSVTYLSWEKPILQNFTEFLSAYLADISPYFLLYSGDPLLRHHIPVMGEILAATLMLAVLGLLIVIIRHHRDSWWLYVVYGLAVSVLPGAMTSQRYHSLRLSAVPVFLLVLTVPAITWLIEVRKTDFEAKSGGLLNRLDLSRTLGIGALVVALSLTLYQAINYQFAFAEVASSRGHVFDQAYLPVLQRALEEPSRPIYLEDGFWGPAYVHAYWYGSTMDIPISNFSHLPENQPAPIGGVVLSSNDKCSRCQIIEKRGMYLLYRVIETDEVREAVVTEQATLPEPPVVRPDAARLIDIQADRPRGIAVDRDGNIYVTDSANAQIQKLSSNGALIASISAPGPPETGLREPSGIAVDASGNLYVTDIGNRSLLRFRSDGTLDKVWSNSQIGLESPIDIEIAADGKLYISDRGKSQIVNFDPATGISSAWGTSGTDLGQFNDIFGIGIGREKLFAADSQNGRVQIFDLAGKSLGLWLVPQWEKYIWHRPDIAVDDEKGQIFVTNGWKNEVLIFNVNGDLTRKINPAPAKPFNNVSAIKVAKTKNGLYLYILNTGSDVVDTGKPSILVLELPLAN